MSTSSGKKVGIVGVGRMGANMARRLAERGFSVTAVYDVRREAATALAKELNCAAPEKLAALWQRCPFVDGVIALENAKNLRTTAKQLKAGNFAKVREGNYDDAGRPGICAGFHYRFSTKVGQDMGRKIGEYVVQSILQPTADAAR